MPAGKSDWLSVFHKIMYGAMFWYFAQVSFNILAWNSDIYTHQLHIYTHMFFAHWCFLCKGRCQRETYSVLPLL